MTTAAFFFHHWLFHPLAGRGYQFWSGIASDLGELTLLVGITAWWTRHNCHVRHCPRLQWKATAASDVVCRHHHPENPKTAEQVTADHQAAARANE